MRRMFLGCLVLAWAVLAVASWAEPGALAERAAGLLQTLDDGQRDDATWPFDDDERRVIRYAPTGLEGFKHGDLDDAGKAAAKALLAATLSARGFEKAEAIRLLERDVAELESWWELGFRDPERYYWAFFGAPGPDAPWAYSFEGHHLSLNVTVVPGHPPASLPLFLGAQPRLVPDGLPSAGVATLGVEEAMVRELYGSLDDAQRKAATLPFEEDRGHMLGQVPELQDPAPIGLARTAMTDAQQATLDELLAHFADFWSADIAAARHAEIDAAREGLHFAFVAAADPPFSFYARVGGPGLLLEMDNTQGGDHVHAVWHRPGDSFGRSLLAAHLRDHHRQADASGSDQP